MFFSFSSMFPSVVGKSVVRVIKIVQCTFEIRPWHLHLSVKQEDKTNGRSGKGKQKETMVCTSTVVAPTTEPDKKISAERKRITKRASGIGQKGHKRGVEEKIRKGDRKRRTGNRTVRHRNRI